ncbi:MAG: hypothetical protein H0X65_20755 [Gemmatimonadetes bacterium]|nr:hypothetical protein [Gemmatimonadota bacterium]
MIIYLAPVLIVLALISAALRLRRRIEPACPACAARAWKDTPVTLACGNCGWAISHRPPVLTEQKAA